MARLNAVESHHQMTSIDHDARVWSLLLYKDALTKQPSIREQVLQLLTPSSKVMGPNVMERVRSIQGHGGTKHERSRENTRGDSKRQKTPNRLLMDSSRRHQEANGRTTQELREKLERSEECYHNLSRERNDTVQKLNLRVYNLSRERERRFGC